MAKDLSLSVYYHDSLNLSWDGLGFSNVSQNLRMVSDEIDAGVSNNVGAGNTEVESFTTQCSSVASTSGLHQSPNHEIQTGLERTLVQKDSASKNDDDDLSALLSEIHTRFEALRSVLNLNETSSTDCSNSESIDQERLIQESGLKQSSTKENAVESNNIELANVNESIVIQKTPICILSDIRTRFKALRSGISTDFSLNNSLEWGVSSQLSGPEKSLENSDLFNELSVSIAPQKTPAQKYSAAFDGVETRTRLEVFEISDSSIKSMTQEVSAISGIDLSAHLEPIELNSTA